MPNEQHSRPSMRSPPPRPPIRWLLALGLATLAAGCVDEGAREADAWASVRDAQRQMGAPPEARPAEAASTLRDDCAADMGRAGLDALRPKVEFIRDPDAPPPAAIADNDTFPSDAELPLIARWAGVRSACLARTERTAGQAPATVGEALVLATFLGDLRHEISARIGALIDVLAAQKLTYGEFARRRFEIGREGVYAEQRFRQALAATGSDAQLKATVAQAATDRAQREARWRAYLDGVAARAPNSVRLASAPASH